MSRARRWRSAQEPDHDRDPAASMALLDEVLDPPIGPGYHSAAQDRVAAGLPATSGSRTWTMLVTSILLGGLVTVAALTLRTPDPAAAETRAQLIDRIESAQAVGDEEGARVEELREDLVRLEQLAASASGETARERIAEAGLLAGVQALVGPGVVLTLDDAPGEEVAPGERVEGERVNARDVQIVVNGLWSAGAEAISVNGHRLTSTSAIRYAGQAIVVDFRSLSPPYEIRAIGDPEALAHETGTGLTGSYLRELRVQFGIRGDVQAQDEVAVAAAERLTTRVGTVAPPETPRPDPTPGTDSDDVDSDRDDAGTTLEENS